MLVRGVLMLVSAGDIAPLAMSERIVLDDQRVDSGRMCDFLLGVLLASSR